MSVKRGALIVLEGCDRSGKTTQCKQLGKSSYPPAGKFHLLSVVFFFIPFGVQVASLLSAGGKAQYMNFPNRSTPSGRLIDEFLRNKSEFDQEAIHLLFTVNRWECKRRMEELLLAGTSIVVDRYSYSGVAYSVAKGLSLDWCKNTEANLLKPDLVLLLSLSDEAIQRRGGFGAERWEAQSICDMQCDDVIFLLQI